MKLLSPKSWFKKSAKVAVIRLAGAIGISSPLSPGLSMAILADLIERAFEEKGIKAVALLINSPGGSPVQSSLIAGRIRALSKEKKIPVYAFCEDVAASGGYWLACAADEIYADECSIIGSIGVVSASFGFVDAIEKLGIERRVFTAGKNKVSLDAFLPLKDEDVNRLKSIQLEIHESFIAMVLKRRGEKVADSTEDLFTGEFWTGKRAVELGLIDGISDVRTKMRDVFGENVELILIEPKKGFLGRTSKLGVMAQMAQSVALLETQKDGIADSTLNVSAGMAEEVMSVMEVKNLWAKYGL